MATDIKQAVKDIFLWGAIIGSLGGFGAYVVLNTIGNEIEQEQAVCKLCEVELRDVEEQFGKGLKLEHWGDYYSQPSTLKVRNNYGEQKTYNPQIAGINTGQTFNPQDTTNEK